jgi:hypothetical protein
MVSMVNASSADAITLKSTDSPGPSAGASIDPPGEEATPLSETFSLSARVSAKPPLSGGSGPPGKPSSAMSSVPSLASSPDTNAGFSPV